MSTLKNAKLCKIGVESVEFMYTPERRSYIYSTHSTLILHNFALNFGVDLTYLALNFSVDLIYLALNLALIVHKFNAFNANLT